MILSCIMVDSLRNALTLVLMHLTQRKTKSINYWLINSLTCPAVSFLVVYNDTFYQITTEVLIGECILNSCLCIFLSDRSFYLLNWHTLIEIYWINYKLFYQWPSFVKLKANIKCLKWSNKSICTFYCNILKDEINCNLCVDLFYFQFKYNPNGPIAIFDSNINPIYLY